MKLAPEVTRMGGNFFNNRMRRLLIGLSLGTYHKMPLGLQLPIRKLYTTLDFGRFLIKNEIVVTTIGGIIYELDLSELIDSSVYYEGCWEPFTTSFIKTHVNLGESVIDIGANIGAISLLLSKQVGDKGRVIAFEPNSFTFKKLSRNVALNGFRNIQLEKKAISDNVQTVLTSINSSYGIRSSDYEKETKENVEFTTLDNYCTSNGLSKLDFVKIDTDGYEYKVVAGGLNTLKKFKPTIVVEMGKETLRRHGDRLEGLINLLAQIGYRFYSERDQKEFASAESLMSLIPDGSAINVVCSAIADNSIDCDAKW